jgi:hypothetical protein
VGTLSAAPSERATEEFSLRAELDLNPRVELAAEALSRPDEARHGAHCRLSPTGAVRVGRLALKTGVR